jgi:thiamine pyrophosphokinase
LTAEEQEEENVNADKQEIKFLKQQDVSSTRNALRLAQQAEETGRDTLARLGAQGERLHKYDASMYWSDSY